jgi:hypothetical protein
MGPYADQARRPVRGVRPRTTIELAFLSRGQVAERLLRAAAAAGTLRLAHELAELVVLEAAWGRPLLLQALERATPFRRFKAADPAPYEDIRGHSLSTEALVAEVAEGDVPLAASGPREMFD